VNGWLWNGSAFEPSTSLPVEDRGFRYGMALFESLRVWQSRPLFLEQHLRRLRRACAEREFPVDDRALSAVGALLSGAPTDGLARIYVAAGDGSVTTPARACRVVVFLEAREPSEPGPCDMAMPHETHRPLFGGLKTANYWAHIDALQRAMRDGKEDALLFNEQAELISSCLANVFVVHRSTVRTPALACGARDGVIREWVMGQMRVKQGSLFVEDLQTADEVFLTSSWLGLRSVGRIAGRELPSRAVCERLTMAYRQTIATGIA
jgi:branched-subunit amino acid aminotransferase/4-amino-4-deoxychorismate lyase